MAKRSPNERLHIVRIDSYEGSDTFLNCGNEQQDFLYAIVATDKEGNAEIVDSSYRSFEEAAEAWPEARPKGGRRSGQR